MAKPVVHFEIATKIAPELHTFYAGLFGWKIDTNNPIGYGLVDTRAGRGINGGIFQSEETPNMVTFYAAVDDLDGTLRKAEKLGGKTVMPVTQVMEDVTVALFTDPEGNCVGLVNDAPPEGQAMGPSAGKGRPVLHFEVGGKDPAKLQKFYADLFGWHVKAENPMNYGEVDTHTGRGIGGGIGPTFDDPYVTFYVGVTDLKKTLAKAAKLGGKTVLEPVKPMADLEIARFADPEGNKIGLFKE